MEKFFKSNKLIYSIIILFGVILCVPLFKMNLNSLNEFRIHIGRVISIKEVMKDGVFPPFISYKHMYGYGYALNIFYGVITTYIPILISMVCGTSIMAVKYFTVLTVVFSGITMYWCTYKITNKRMASLVAALIYMTAPYKICDIYSRNAVGEYTAFIFIPMVFQGVYQLLHNDKKGNYFLVIGATLLVLSHTITTIYTAIFVGFYLLFNYKELKNKIFWKTIFIDGIIILMLSAFYTVPLIEHKLFGNYVIFNPDSMHTTAQDVYYNTNSVLDWFKWEVHSDLNFSFGLVIGLLMLSTVLTFKKIDKENKNQYLNYLTLAIISLYLCTKAFPWFLMPGVLTVIQFAWRMDGFFIFFISLVCGLNAEILGEKIIKHKREVLLFIMTLILILTVLSTSLYIQDYSSEKENEYEQSIIEAESISLFSINREYMPDNAYADFDYIKNRKNVTYLLSGNAIITNENKVKLHDEFEINNVENAEFELPYLYYLGYTVKVNGKRVETYESEKGFVAFKTNENGKVEVDYTGTITEKVALGISLVGLISIIGYMVIKKKVT